LENARLLALAQGKTAVPSETGKISAPEQLSSELAAAEDQERKLNAELAPKSAAAIVPVKVEPSLHLRWVDQPT
jgi:hypothetical protein